MNLARWEALATKEGKWKGNGEWKMLPWGTRTPKDSIHEFGWNHWHEILVDKLTLASTIYHTSTYTVLFFSWGSNLLLVFRHLKQRLLGMFLAVL